MPKVSVIIPAYNRGRFLGECIQSVLDQTYQDFELIVVDDGSTDNTKEVVDSFSYPGMKYIYQQNRGASSARNTGIQASIGKYIAFLDSDDMWLPKSLELKVNMLDSRPNIALSCSDAYFFDNETGASLGRFWHDKPLHYWTDPIRASKQPLRELLHRGCFIAPQMAVMRREVFTEVGLFDESLRNHVDWDMFVRIVQRFPIGVIDIPLTKCRRHGDSLTADREEMYQGQLVVLHKAIDGFSLSKEDMKVAKGRLARVCFYYGQYMVRNGRMAMGREKLVASIKDNPWRIKAYIWLAISLLGTRAFLTLRSFKKWYERHLA